MADQRLGLPSYEQVMVTVPSPHRRAYRLRPKRPADRPVYPDALRDLAIRKKTGLA